MAGKPLDVFISNGMMHFTGRSIECTENWEMEFNFDKDIVNETDFLVSEVYEDLLTILLNEDLDYKTFKDEMYPGNVGAIHQKIYTQVYY